LWDTAVYARDAAFDGLRQWLSDTIDIFSQWQDRQLVIRVHPAEVRLALQTTRTTLADYISAHHPVLPDNVRVVPPESSMSSYMLGRLSTACLVYASTIGLELAVMGKPVVVAGQVHYRAKGFTLDVERREDYRDVLLEALSRPTLEAERAKRALQYADFFFFRTAVPFPIIDNTVPGHVNLDLESIARVANGEDPTTNAIAEALLAHQEVLSCVD